MIQSVKALHVIVLLLGMLQSMLPAEGVETEPAVPALVEADQEQLTALVADLVAIVVEAALAPERRAAQGDESRLEAVDKRAEAMRQQLNRQVLVELGELEHTTANVRAAISRLRERAEERGHLPGEDDPELVRKMVDAIIKGMDGDEVEKEQWRQELTREVRGQLAADEVTEEAVLANIAYSLPKIEPYRREQSSDKSSVADNLAEYLYDNDSPTRRLDAMYPDSKTFFDAVYAGHGHAWKTRGWLLHRPDEDDGSKKEHFVVEQVVHVEVGRVLLQSDKKIHPAQIDLWTACIAPDLLKMLLRSLWLAVPDPDPKQVGKEEVVAAAVAEQWGLETLLGMVKNKPLLQKDLQHVFKDVKHSAKEIYDIREYLRARTPTAVEGIIKRGLDTGLASDLQHSFQQAAVFLHWEEFLALCRDSLLAVSWAQRRAAVGDYSPQDYGYFSTRGIQEIANDVTPVGNDPFQFELALQQMGQTPAASLRFFSGLSFWGNQKKWRPGLEVHGVANLEAVEAASDAQEYLAAQILFPTQSRLSVYFHPSVRYAAAERMLAVGPRAKALTRSYFFAPVRLNAQGYYAFGFGGKAYHLMNQERNIEKYRAGASAYAAIGMDMGFWGEDGLAWWDIEGFVAAATVTKDLGRDVLGPTFRGEETGQLNSVVPSAGLRTSLLIANKFKLFGGIAAPLDSGDRDVLGDSVSYVAVGGTF